MSKLTRKLTRRQFSKKLAAVAVTATASSLFSSCASSPEKSDVLVIGAGLSGLNSARLLRNLGLKVVVLEAGSRVGGRAHTLQTEAGPLDLGASQVGRGYARVRRACQDLGLRLLPENRDLLDFGMHFQGSWIDPKTWAQNPLNKCVGDERLIPPFMMGRAIVGKYNPMENLEDWFSPEFAEWDISLRELMVSKGHSEQAIQLAAATVPGISIDDTSVLRMFQEMTRGKYERRFSPSNAVGGSKESPLAEANVRSEDGSEASVYNIEGGAQNLPIAMAEQLGDAVRLNKKVTGIELSDNSALVSCADGSRYASTFVISALPFTLLKDIEISGIENTLVDKARNEMPYANTARLFVEVDKPFWEVDGLPPCFSTDGPMGMFWAIDSHGESQVHSAMIILIGEAGRAISATSNPEDFVMQELSRLRPASKGLIKKIAFKDWASDPLQKGCGYSFAPGQMNGFVRDMIKPWKAMHFAGEHTRRLDFGMEAALESSERVVTEIIGRA